MPVTKNIFIFGDSITYGEWDERSGWANRIRAHYDDLVLPVPDNYTITYNLGIPSDTSAGLAYRLEQETNARLTLNPGVSNIQFIVAIGTNDACWLKTEKRRGIDINKFKANLQTITCTMQKFSNDIVYIGLLPCDEEEVHKVSVKHEWVEVYDNPTQVEYNNVVNQHCIDSNLKFVNLYDEFIGRNHKQLLTDGLHPNTEGHALIFKSVLSVL